MRTKLFVVTAALVAAACSDDGAMNWRDELVALSQTRHAPALHYLGGIDHSMADGVMDGQCRAIDDALTNPAFDDEASVLAQITASIETQRAQGVPDELIRRDLAALDAGMQERCPSIHERVAAYFPVERFEDLSLCGPISIGDDAEARVAACRE